MKAKTHLFIKSPPKRVEPLKLSGEGNVKLLHVVPSFGLGGMEKVLCAMINAFPSTCYQGILSLTGCLDATKWINRKSVDRVSFKRPPGNFHYLRALHQAIRNWAPDVMMTYNWGATDALWLGKMCGVRHIIHSEHGFNADEATATQWKRNLIRYVVYRCASKVVVVSRDLETMMNDQFRLSKERVCFIANGIDTDFYSPNLSERKKMREELGFVVEDIVVGYAGRLDPVKNFPLLLDAFRLALRKDGRFKLLLIGDGPERRKIEGMCQEFKIQDQVIFAGQQENVLPFLRVLDIYGLTSFREQLPMSLLEAMAVGIPVFASAVGEIPFLLDGQAAGFIHELSEGPGAFSQSLLKLRNPELRKHMGDTARGIVMNQYRQKTMVQDYCRLLEDVTGGKWRDETFS